VALAANPHGPAAAPAARHRHGLGAGRPGPAALSRSISQ
jgi:hypothetical protein